MAEFKVICPVPLPLFFIIRGSSPTQSGDRGLGTRLAAVIGAFAFAVLLSTSYAFPPAPFFTLYGTVRDEQGQTLRVDGAVVIFYKNGVEKLRQTIIENTELDQNYQIRLRMDMQRGGTVSYSDLANAAGSSFSMAILIHNIAYQPVEMSVTRTIGQPGQRVRLDLTLGVDSDGDGLPDVWEESQLFAAGVVRGPNGWDLSAITRNGDYDHDGISNYDEYVAGTFATDPTDYLSLRIVGKSATSAHLQFFSIYGKRYTLETSSDLTTWSPASFYLSSPDPVPVDPNNIDAPPPPVPPVAQSSLQATSTGVTDIYANLAADSARAFFYRLKVR
jgi:hypothetical protein